MSQCSRATSTPNSLIAAAPTEPMTSSCGAIASRARPSRSSLSRCGSMPYTSSTAIAAAHASTCTSGVGAVSRFATSASLWNPRTDARSNEQVSDMCGLQLDGHR